MRDPEVDEEWQNRIIYSLPVHIGTWSYDMAAEEEKAALTVHKRKRCQLLIQNTRKMLNNLLRPMTLVVESPYVMYNRNYLISACDIPKKGTSQAYFLSGLITDREINNVQQLCEGCIMTTSPHTTTACVRNTFSLTGCDPTTEIGLNVCYGDDVYIRLANSEGTPLYVQFETASMASFGDNISVNLSASPNFYCKFKIYHWNPQLRMEYVGNAFQPNQRIIIQHTATGKNLTAEYFKWIPTFFGPECSVTCNTYRDSHKMETAENFWSFIATRRTNLNLFFRAAKGENVSTDFH